MTPLLRISNESNWLRPQAKGEKPQMRKLLLIGLVLFVPLGTANAQGTQGSGPSPYVECGIGAALFPNTPWAAVTSNAIWDIGTTAIISAVSSLETCNAAKVSTDRLILETLPNLEQDVALGEGEYLVSLHETMGCEVEARDDLNTLIRATYADTVDDAEYATRSRIEKAEWMYASVRAAVETSAESCTAQL